MKTVVLIGDSIRMGYQETVRQELDGVETWAPEANGGTSRNILNHLDEWVLSRQLSVVHLNCGLHDLKREFGATQNQVPVAEYEENVRRILEQIREKTDAIVTWASTTPVNEKLHHENKGFDRFEADVRAYNEAAGRVVESLDIPSNDLFEVVQQAGTARYLKPDGVHFTDDGSRLLGKAVAGFIRPYLEG